MRTTSLFRTAAVVGGVAAALTLSACDGISINFGGDDGQRQQTPAPQDPEAGTDTGTDGGTDGTRTDDGTGGGTEAGNGTAQDPNTGGTGTDGGTDTGGTDTGGTGGGDTSQQTTDFSIDHNGNGVIPEALLEDDIERAYEEQGTAVDSVDCSSDMHIFHYTGSQNCTVMAGGQEHYGLVKVTNVEGQQVYYELQF